MPNAKDIQQTLATGFKVMEYRKLGMRWCKLQRMFGMRQHSLQTALQDYENYLQSGGEPFLGEELRETE